MPSIRRSVPFISLLILSSSCSFKQQARVVEISLFLSSLAHDRAPWAMFLQTMSIHSQGQKGQTRNQKHPRPSEEMVGFAIQDSCADMARLAISRRQEQIADLPNAPGNGSASQTRSAPVNQHLTTTFPAHGRYGPSSPLSMGNMAYSLPSPQSHSSPFDPHLAHQYASTQHPQGMVYPMQSMGHYPGSPHASGVPYGMPYPPAAYGHYPAHPHPGAQPGSGPYYGAHVPMQNMGMGQGPVYAGTYYTHTYHAPYGPPPQPGHLPQSRPQARPGSRGYLQSKPNIPRKDSERRTEFEYDVTKTIVDGSNPRPVSGTDPSAAVGMSETLVSFRRG